MLGEMMRDGDGDEERIEDGGARMEDGGVLSLSYNERQVTLVGQLGMAASSSASTSA